MATSDVGTITSLWRYPVKSMMGEELLEQRREGPDTRHRQSGCWRRGNYSTRVAHESRVG
jgi:hypothetical protein